MSFFDKLKSAFGHKEDKAIYLSGFKKSNDSFGNQLKEMKHEFTGINDSFLEDLTVVLLESDVGIETADLICEKLKEKAEEYPSLSFDWAMSFLLEIMKEIYEEVDDKPIVYNETGTTVILLEGVNGSGKTTTAAKLASMYLKQGKSVAFVAADTFRAGAIEQLAKWSEKLGITCIKGRENGDPSAAIVDGCRYAKENNIDFWEGKGVCHQVMIENYVRPGELIFGADSHTCSYGALGAFGTGVGCTDFLYGMVTGTSWVLVPESVKFNLTGKLPEGVTARDLILTIIGEVGANGCNYQVMEFTGEGAKTLSISDRMTLCNMAVEAGAKTGIFEADEKAMEYLKEHGREPKAVFHSDPDAKYVREYTFDLSKVRPVVAKPDFVDNVVPAEEACGIEINEAFLGSCNNGRIEDLRVGAEIIKGKKVSDKVRFLVVPASQTIYRQALKEGLIDIFMEAGAIVMNPNCSVCWGSCQGVIGENEVLISTGTRNFKGRAGHPSSKVYLGSAATVTASAVAGKIALPSEI